MISPTVSAQDNRRFAASLTATITGDSTGSRYFWALVDTALAETAWMQCDTMDGTGAYFTYLKCPKDNYDKVKKTVAQVLDELVEKGVTQEELDSARNKVLSSVTIKCETPMGRLLNLGINWQYLKQYRRVEDDIADIMAVKVDDVNSILSEYKPNKFSEFVLKAGTE
jgi:predicted Zn-dependent peptidase